MATPVVMPALGMTMEEGRVAEWLAADGQLVERGQLIVRLSTDKIEVEVEAEAGGILRQLVAAG
ncbi:MAG TPA: biotin/lipoyl-containing protein, partial [Dehalococcoidia bacterium]|nr:biotin/lipoyl-containing protein [Dehalococcoidia bacterium]